MFSGATLAARACGGFAMLKMFLNLAAAGALFAIVGSASAQEIREVDPNAPTSWNEPASPRPDSRQAAAPQREAEDWTPVERQAPARGGNCADPDQCRHP